MFYIPKIDDYSNILNGNAVKKFINRHFFENFKSNEGKLCSELS